MKRRVLEALNAMPGCKAVKLHGTAFMEAGTPDVHATYRGRSCWIELKAPGKGPSTIQEKRLAEWAEAGALVGVATSAAEAVAIVTGARP